jgi:hypothetical protein
MQTSVMLLATANRPMPSGLKTGGACSTSPFRSLHKCRACPDPKTQIEEVDR